MGALNDFRAGQVVFDDSAQAAGSNRAIQRYLDYMQSVQGDVAYPTGFATDNEVQSIPLYTPTVSGGTFDLDFTLADGTLFSANAIAFGANAATIEGAIDTGATGNVTGWTNGDISVSGGDLNTAPVVLTFNGASVSGANHGLTVIDGALLTGGGSANAITQTTAGQANRAAWAMLKVLNVVDTIPEQGQTTGFNVIGDRGIMYLNPPAVVLKALALQAAIDDGVDAIETILLDGLRANGVAV